MDPEIDFNRYLEAEDSVRIEIDRASEYEPIVGDIARTFEMFLTDYRIPQDFQSIEDILRVFRRRPEYNDARKNILRGDADHLAQVLGATILAFEEKRSIAENLRIRTLDEDIYRLRAIDSLKMFFIRKIRELIILKQQAETIVQAVDSSVDTPGRPMLPRMI
jgi:hypothetical protein